MSKAQPLDRHVSTDKEPEVEKWFRAAIKAGASDLHLKVGMPPKMRIHGKLKHTTGENLTEQPAEAGGGGMDRVEGGAAVRA
jgi:twitching motility protein PilT